MRGTGLGKDILGAHLGKRAVPCRDIRMKRIWFLFDFLRRRDIFDHLLTENDAILSFVFLLVVHDVDFVFIVAFESVLEGLI